MTSQTLAASNPQVRPVVRAVLAELLVGATRERGGNGVNYAVEFTPFGPSGIVVTVRDSSTGANFGSWRLALEAL